jgi:hypothetical protein
LGLGLLGALGVLVIKCWSRRQPQRGRGRDGFPGSVFSVRSVVDVADDFVLDRQAAPKRSYEVSFLCEF